MADDDDIRTLVREFRTRVTAELAANQKRMDDFETQVRNRLAEMGQRIGEMGQRIGTAETAIVNTIRELASATDRRFTKIDDRLTGIETTQDDVKAALAKILSKLGDAD